MSGARTSDAVGGGDSGRLAGLVAVLIRRARMIEFVGLACLLLVSLRIFGVAAEAVPFHPDESQYIYTSHYFEYLFLEHDIQRVEWGDNYWTHTQPTLVRYVIGLSEWVNGAKFQQLPGPYDFSRTLTENVRLGTVPTQAQLSQARTPMVLFASGLVLVLYGLSRAFGGPVAGLVASILALASPLSTGFLVRAWAEAPFAFFLFSGLLLTVVAARKGRAGGLQTGWALLAGLAFGLGLATKLTIALSLVALGFWAALLMLMALMRNGRLDLRETFRLVWRIGRGWVFALVVAGGVFILSNPHLYPNPLRHVNHLITQRSQEMALQALPNPQYALNTLSARIAFVFSGSLIRGAAGGPPAHDESIDSPPPSGSQNLPFELPLCAVGVGALLATVRRSWRSGRQIPVEGFILFAAFVNVVGIAANILVAFDRYLLPTLYLGIVLSSVGAAFLVQRLYQLLRVERVSGGGRLRPYTARSMTAP